MVRAGGRSVRGGGRAGRNVAEQQLVAGGRPGLARPPAGGRPSQLPPATGLPQGLTNPPHLRCCWRHPQEGH